MYFWIRLKYLLRSKKFFFLFVSGLCLGLLLLYTRNATKSLTEMTVSVRDEDRTETSKRLKEALGKLSGIRFSDTGDIVYELKKGFEKGFQTGNLTGLIRVRGRENDASQDIMNDRIGSEVVKQYIYYDLFQRIKKKNNISKEEYERVLLKTERENEILVLNTISKEGEKIAENEEADAFLWGKYMIFLCLSLAGLYLHILSFEELKRREKTGMTGRLRSVGVKKIAIELSEGGLNFIGFTVFLLPFLLASGMFFAPAVGVGILFFFISFFLCLLLDLFIKTEEAFGVIAKISGLCFIVIGVYLVYIRF